MTLETREEEELLAKVRALDATALDSIWEVKKRVNALDAKIDTLIALCEEILKAQKSRTPAV